MHMGCIIALNEPPRQSRQQFQARKDLLMRESGSRAVSLLVSFFFMPSIRAQKLSRRAPPFGCGGFRFMPCALADARPLAFRPPFGFLPSLRCQAGVFAITSSAWPQPYYRRGLDKVALLSLRRLSRSISASWTEPLALQGRTV